MTSIIAKPAVTREEFEKITCNRCGQCCEKFWLNDTIFEENKTFMPHRGTKETSSKEDIDIETAKVKSWLQDVVLLERPIDTDGAYYTCSRFTRDIDTKEGICTQYEDRSSICADFPYFRPVSDVGFDKCSWFVRLIDPIQDIKEGGHND